jgi:hypothetical protein
MDPLGIGDGSAILTLLQSYPRANEPGGDGLNTGGFRFAANEAANFDTYIAKIDYNITSNGPPYRILARKSAE